MRSLNRNRLARFFLLVLSLGLSLVAAELVARLTGYRPARARSITEEPSTVFDGELGWTNRPGAHLPWGDGEAIFWPDASRRTRRVEHTAAQRAVLVLGCSYTQGFGVRDEDTFAWKLQQRFPEFDFRNFGTAAYGTYQSLLRFRRWLREGHRPPELVIYGFAAFQGVRDRATRAWMDQLVQTRGFVPPHVDIVRGRVVEFAGRSLPRSQWSQRFALWNLAEGEFEQEGDFAIDDRALTIGVQKSVLEMLQKEVASAGSRLLLANLWTAPVGREEWRRFFADQRMLTADCSVDGLPYRHPDLFWHARHADCIEEAIRSSGVLHE